MRPLTRAGFTLTEQLISLVLLAMFASVVVAVVRAAGRVATRSSATLLADRSVVTVREFLQEELRDGAIADLSVLSPTRIALSRAIGEARPCFDGAGVVLIADSSWHGTRAPEGGRDDAQLLTDPVLATWIRIPIDSTGRDRCPVSNAPAMRILLAAHPGSALVVRIFEPVELSAYRSGSNDWFGLTPANHTASVQPFAGPLETGATRFTLLANHLDVAAPPVHAPASTVVTPLAATP